MLTISVTLMLMGAAPRAQPEVDPTRWLTNPEIVEIRKLTTQVEHEVRDGGSVAQLEPREGFTGFVSRDQDVPRLAQVEGRRASVTTTFDAAGAPRFVLTVIRLHDAPNERTLEDRVWLRASGAPFFRVIRRLSLASEPAGYRAVLLRRDESGVWVPADRKLPRTEWPALSAPAGTGWEAFPGWTRLPWSEAREAASDAASRIDEQLAEQPLQNPPTLTVGQKDAASVKTCSVALSRASAGELTCAGATRRNHGWVGLKRDGKRWRLVPLTSKKDDEGDSFTGICASEDTGVALKGAQLTVGPREVVALSADSSVCRLRDQRFHFAGKQVRLKASGTTVHLEGLEKPLVYELTSDCWTGGTLVDLDQDGAPDLVLERTGGGFVYELYLSSNASSSGEIRVCAGISGPPC